MSRSGTHIQSNKKGITVKFSIKKAAAIGVAAVAVTAGVWTASPASAAPGAGVIAYTGTAHLSCFGCGVKSDGQFAGTAAGAGATTAGPVVVNGAITANNFTYNESNTDPQCVVQGTADGSVNVGPYAATFHWQRVGAIAIVTLSNVNGGGLSGGVGASAAAFGVTSPVGDPCGKAVTATVIGAAAVASAS
jgi:hypothetical protein